MSTNLLTRTMSFQEKFPVVGLTISPGKMFTLTESAKSSFCIMLSCVGSVVSKFKVFYSIVSFNFVQMVNNLIRSKVSSEMFFHNQAMLTNVTVSINKRMLGRPNHNVTAISHNFTTLPIGVLFPVHFSLKVASATLLRLKPSRSFGRTRESDYSGASRTSFFNHYQSLI